ncbi:MAG TPA: glycosyltransferase [Desulfobacterales bacterium]
MKICMFTNTYKPHVGGVARSVAFFAENLRARGNRVLVVAPEFPGTEDEQNESVLRIPAIQEFNGSDFSLRLPAPFKVDQKVEAFDPKIIHSHHPFLMGDTALRVARGRNLPLVFTHHTLYEQYTHYVPLNSEAMERFVIRLATDYANFCTRVVAPSESIADLIRERGVQRPVDVVPTGVDLTFFSGGDGDSFRREHRIPLEAQVIGHLGRLAPEKNLDYLARAVAAFGADRPESRFLVVGEGPSRAEIRHRFRERQIEDRLLLAGEQTGQALADAYQAMDLFVFASQSETQGMVLAEAMAAGKPVVALNASGSREVVSDRVNGRLLPADADEKTFAEAIAEFFDAPEQAAKWVEAAGKTAREFSRKNCAWKLTDVYQNAVEEHDRSALTDSEELPLYDELLEKIRCEWDLISKKMSAAANAVRSDEAE